ARRGERTSRRPAGAECAPHPAAGCQRIARGNDLRCKISCRFVTRSGSRVTSESMVRARALRLSTAMTLALALAAGTAMPPARSQPDLHAELHADGAPWRGRIELPGASLDIVVRFAADEDGKVTRGTIDIPAQGAVGLPLGDISVDGARVSFRLPNVPGNARFSGELRGETLAGRFEQSGGRFPFELNRSPANAEPSPRRPQTPQ